MDNFKYIRSIDGLRAVAILGVLATHFGLYRSGWLGVQLFFVISGYLIISILLREKESKETITFLIKRFYYRRSLRIFPLYYFYLIVLVLVYIFYYHKIEELLAKLPSMATYTYNLTRISSTFTYSNLVNHLWSLCVEEQFYLAFPFIIFMLNLKNLKRLFIFILFFSPVFRMFLYLYCHANNIDDYNAGDIVYVLTPSHFDAFVTGGAITLFSLDKKLNSLAIFLICTVAFVLSGIINSYLLGESYFKNLGYGVIGVQNYQHIWSYSIANLFFAAIILLLVSQQQSRIKRFLSYVLETPFFVAIGRVSYGMYIYHWVILTFYNQLIKLPFYLNFAVYCFVVFVISYFSFQIFELKFINLKNKYFTLVK